MALAPLAPETRNLIDGQLVDASNGDTFENVNPATEEVIGTRRRRHEGRHGARGRRRAARLRRDDWSTDHAFRAQLPAPALRGAEGGERAAALDRRARGRRAGLATGFMHVDDPIEMMAYWADKAASYPYERRMSGHAVHGPPNGRILRREAVGVVGAITPWNVPLYLNIAKIGPALAAGCTVVLKPAPDTPWWATHIGKLIAERTDIPPGVVNIVASSDHLLGEMLSTDPRVDLVTFTGSTATGRRVMESARPR